MAALICTAVLIAAIAGVVWFSARLAERIQRALDEAFNNRSK